MRQNNEQALDEVRGAGAGDVEPCPVCGQTGARDWLCAPDRLHGRSDLYRLVRCPACSLVWLSDPPCPKEMHLHYTADYHRLISSAGEDSAARWRDRTERVMRFKQSGAILDLGCSSGGFLGTLNTNSWKLFGIEMSADCAKRAATRLGARVFVGDIPDAPFPPESFDVITCFDVLEHVYEPQRVLARVQEWLKPEGVFYVQVPNIDSAEARVFGSYWHGLELPRHLFHFSPASLERLAAAAGLRAVSLETRRNPAIGTSFRYIGDDLFRAIGLQRTPVAYRGKAGLPWRAARKLVRLTLQQLLIAMAPLAGGGEAIHAVFRKERTSSR